MTETCPVCGNSPPTALCKPVIPDAAQSVGMREALELCEDVLRVVQEVDNVPESPIINLAREKAKAALAAHGDCSAGSEQLETYDAWLAPETFHSLPMRERVHYTVKMLGSVNLTKEACDRQARRITDALEAAGLIPSEPQGVRK